MADFYAAVDNCSLIFTARRDDGLLLQHTRIDCSIADTLHPLGEHATPKAFRGRRILDREAFLNGNVVCQKSDQLFSSLVDYFPQPQGDKRPIRLVHAVNFFPISGALDKVQLATARSMQKAAQEASLDDGETVLLHVQSLEDPDLTPDGFCRGSDLQRNIGDVVQFATTKSLPLVFDILDNAAKEAAPDDYIIFTNADICVRPGFYDAIRYLLRAGFDAITVNRRTLGKNLINMPPALAETENGLLHGGFDCFIFSRRAYKDYRKTKACVGVAGVARSVLYNMVAFAETMLILKNVDLTYHFGNDRDWLDVSYSELTQHNRTEFLTLLADLSQREPQRKLLQEFCFNHPEPKSAQALF